LRSAAKYYYEEVRLDLEEMAWEELFHKYRTTFWEGLAKRSIAASAPKRSPAKRK
jgi:hypothetical protein